ERECQDLCGRLVGCDDLPLGGIPYDHPTRRHRVNNTERIVCQIHLNRPSRVTVLSSRAFGVPGSASDVFSNSLGRLHGVLLTQRASMLQLVRGRIVLRWCHNVEWTGVPPRDRKYLSRCGSKCSARLGSGAASSPSPSRRARPSPCWPTWPRRAVSIHVSTLPRCS